MLRFFEKIIKEDKKILGRWNINYCEKITNTKIDRANEDHCGPCQKTLKKTTKQINGKTL